MDLYFPMTSTVVPFTVVPGKGFYGVQDGRHRHYRYDNGSTGWGGGVVVSKGIKEWKRKSRKFIWDHREGQDNEKGGKDKRDRGRLWGGGVGVASPCPNLVFLSRSSSRAHIPLGSKY